MYLPYLAFRQATQSRLYKKSHIFSIATPINSALSYLSTTYKDVLQLASISSAHVFSHHPVKPYILNYSCAVGSLSNLLLLFISAVENLFFHFHTRLLASPPQDAKKSHAINMHQKLQQRLLLTVLTENLLKNRQSFIIIIIIIILSPMNHPPLPQMYQHKKVEQVAFFLLRDRLGPSKK